MTSTRVVSNASRKDSIEEQDVPPHVFEGTQGMMPSCPLQLHVPNKRHKEHSLLYQAWFGSFVCSATVACGTEAANA